MADQKLTELSALASITTDDLLYVVDDPAGTATSYKMTFATIDARYLLGSNNLSDIAVAATARTNLGLAIGTDVQAYDAFLTSIAALGTAADKLIYTTGVDTAAEAAITAAGRAILDDADASAQRTTLGLVIGTNVQAYDAQLADIAALAVTDGNFIVGDGANWVAENGATARTSLGLGTIATQDANNVTISGGAVTGITDITIADGGTGASTAQAAIDALTQVSGATDEHVLTKDTGTGNAIFKAAAGGGGSPGGSDTQVQFNDSSSFGGDAGLVYNKTTNVLTITAGGITVPGGADSEIFGAGAVASGASGVAVGNAATTGAGAQSVAIGTIATATGNFSVAIGRNASASTYANSVVIGRNASVTGNSALAIGSGVTAGSSGLVIGSSASGTGNRSTAVGTNSVANGDNTTVYGYAATGTTTVRTVAVGDSATGSGNDATALGYNCAAAVSSVAVGSGANASGSTTVAIGEGSIASATDSIALGRATNAGHLRSIALGEQAATTKTYQLVIGSSAAAINEIFQYSLTALTNSIQDQCILSHKTSGTPAAGFGGALLFQLESTTTDDQSAGRLTYEWATATHATRKALSKWTVYDTAEREGVRIEADGSNPMIGFFGASAVVQQTGCAVPTDLATSITAITALRTALNNLGLTTVV